MFWVPQTGQIGVGISILSYNGRVHFGVISDSQLIDDPWVLTGAFRKEFEKLLVLALIEPWQPEGDVNAPEPDK